MSSLELLEMERPPPKIIKHDSLSIYESTLLKLKQGSHCNPSCRTEDSVKNDNDTHCIMTTDLQNEAAITANSDSSSNSSSDFQSTGSSREQGAPKYKHVNHLQSHPVES
ncbi:Unknown protein [Striga hermonthica]|uniref:Uncharacterized protein n=1 Tax=Striga hermonthica TaxID=68872 RepID=A0A9N7R1S4_STRHE|nr:Unknown protein [Striga hermonthica]